MDDYLELCRFIRENASRGGRPRAARASAADPAGLGAAGRARDAPHLDRSTRRGSPTGGAPRSAHGPPGGRGRRAGRAATHDGEPPSATLRDPSLAARAAGLLRTRRPRRAASASVRGASRRTSPSRGSAARSRPAASSAPCDRIRPTMPPIGRGLVACLAAVASCGTKGASEMHDATVVDVAPPVDPLCASAEDAGMTTSPPFAFVPAILTGAVFLAIRRGRISFSPAGSPEQSRQPRRATRRVVWWNARRTR